MSIHVNTQVCCDTVVCRPGQSLLSAFATSQLMSGLLVVRLPIQLGPCLARIRNQERRAPCRLCRVAHRIHGCRQVAKSQENLSYARLRRAHCFYEGTAVLASLAFAEPSIEQARIDPQRFASRSPSLTHRANQNISSNCGARLFTLTATLCP